MIVALLIIGVGAIAALKIIGRKYYNPYKLILYYGKKGCGKSTLAQKIIYQHAKKGWHIYCNDGDSNYKYATQIDASKLWTYDYKPKSLIVIDEVNLLWDNRDFKTFPRELSKWFRLQRHYQCKVILFSQTADADKKIRDLTDRVYLIKRYFDCIICATPYEKEIIYIEPKAQGQVSGFLDHYKKLNFGPINCEYCWLPKWIKTHDSYKTLDIDSNTWHDNTRCNNKAAITPSCVDHARRRRNDSKKTIKNTKSY